MDIKSVSSVYPAFVRRIWLPWSLDFSLTSLSHLLHKYVIDVLNAQRCNVLVSVLATCNGVNPLRLRHTRTQALRREASCDQEWRGEEPGTDSII